MGHLACPIKKQTPKQAAKRKGLEELSQKHNLSPGYLKRQIHVARTSLAREIKKQSDCKHSLPTEKELSSRHLCLHTTDQSWAQDSAKLQQYVLLRNKLVTQVVIRATESFNLHCNNAARQVEEKCCPYYRTFKALNVRAKKLPLCNISAVETGKTFP